MVYNIIYMVIWIISVLVTVDLFDYTLKWLYNVRSKDDVSKIKTIIIKDDQENIEYVIRRILLVYNLNFKHYNLLIVCSNLKSNETKKICSIISRNLY